MAKKTTFEFDTKVLDGLIKHVGGNVTEAVAKAAFMVEGRAKLKVPVDTGALKSSIYVSMKRGSKGNEAMAAAKARRPEAITTPLPVPRDEHTAHIGPSVEYGQEIEMGSVQRAGRPYLQPAMRETEADIKKLLGQAVKDGR